MPKQTKIIETSLTLGYRQSWGPERTVLDGISNHLPADSGGTEAGVMLKQEGLYVDLKKADPCKPTEEVVFYDNGKGYPADLLGIFHSTKAGSPEAVGQFGEGIKLAAVAALRDGNKIVYQSRDEGGHWEAVPYAKEIKIGGETIQKLCFEITYGVEAREGSRTILKNPSKELLDEVFKIPENVLFFNKGCRELYSEEGKVGRYKSRIIDTKKPPALFVKGIKINNLEERTIFSYDLGTQEIAPDRGLADMDIVEEEIERLLKDCDNPDIIERALNVANEHLHDTFLEFDALCGGRGHGEDSRNLWTQTFKKMFGNKAIIASYNTDKNKEAKLKGYTPVDLNSDVADHLSGIGIQTVDKLVKNIGHKWVKPKDLTYKEKKMLGRSEEINNLLEEAGFETDEFRIKVFSHATLSNGEEDRRDGVFVHKRDRTKSYIGIRRDVLKNFRDFTKTYIHELGHGVTGADDYDRSFTDYFVNVLSAFVVEKMEPSALRLLLHRMRSAEDSYHSVKEPAQPPLDLVAACLESRKSKKTFMQRLKDFFTF